MNNSVVYIQDIDTTVLNQSNLDKIISYYSIQSREDLSKKNTLHTIIGGFEYTNLPDNTFDLIYSNATVHAFSEIDSIMIDMGRKLKPEGALYLRDSFRNDHGEGEFCSDKKCGGRLLTIEEFLAVMKRNNFTLIKQSPDMKGYPVFGFKKDHSK